jgi:hypothetical protein
MQKRRKPRRNGASQIALDTLPREHAGLKGDNALV